MTIPILATTTTMYDILTTQTNAMAALWNNLGAYNAINITGGAIDGVTIGGISPNVGTFTNLYITNTADFSEGTMVFPSANISSALNVSRVNLTAAITSSSQATTKTYVDAAISASLGTLSSVATSGAYADLTGKPTLGSLAALSTVSYSNIQNLSAQYVLLGRSSSGAGIVQEVPTSATVFTMLGSANLGTLQTNIGLGTSSLVQHGSLGLGVSAPGAGNLQAQKTITFGAELDNGTKSSTFNIDWSQAQKQKVTLGTSSVTMTFSNPAGPGHFQLQVVQDGTGTRTKGTWPTILTPGGGSSAWTLSTTASAIDVLNLYWSGSAWYGLLSLGWA